MPTPEKWSLAFILTNYSFAGDLEGGLLYWGTQKIGICFRRGPTFGEHGWALLSWGLLIRGILIRSLRDTQNAL
jgi:hypothetical protein